MRYLLLLLFTLSACSHSTKLVSSYVGPSCPLEAIVDKFYKEVNEQGLFLDHDVAVTFSQPMQMCNDDDRAIGCASGQYVEVLTEWWLASTCEEREALVYHELGHAILHLEHKDGTLMDPVITGAVECLRRDRKTCLQEAVSRNQKMIGLIHDEEIHKIQTRQLR